MTGIQEGMTAAQVSATIMGNFSEVSEQVAEAKQMTAAEEERAKSAEQNLLSAVAQNVGDIKALREVAATKEALSALAEQVDSNQQGATKNAEDIVAEKQRAIAAEQSNAAAIEAEKQRAIAAEGEIRGSVESLSEDLNAASEDIGKLEVAIEAEASRAKAAEQALSVEITEAENRVDERVTEVRDNLEAEVQARSEAVADLEANTGISEYPAFDPAADYVVGDVVNYEGRLRRFVAEHEAGEWIGTDAEAWNESKAIEGKVTKLSMAINNTQLEPIRLTEANSYRVTRLYKVYQGNCKFIFSISKELGNSLYIQVKDKEGKLLLDTTISAGTLVREKEIFVSDEHITIGYAYYSNSLEDIIINTSVNYNNNIINEINNNKESLSFLDERLGEAYSRSSEIEVKTGKYLSYVNGEEKEFASGVYTDFIKFIPTSRYLYSGKYAYEISPILYYDKDKKFISSYIDNYNDTFVTLDGVISNIPANTAYVRFSGYSGAKVIVKSLEELFSGNDNNISKIKTRLDEVEKEIDLSKITASVLQYGFVDIDGTLKEYESGRYSDFYEVEGKVFDYRGTTSYRATFYVFYDENKSRISSYPDTYQSTRLYVDVKSVAPPSNAKYVRFSGLFEDFSAVIYSNRNLRKEIDLINEELNKLQYKGENKLYGKSVIWVGDSITEGSVRMTPPFGGWAKIIADKNTMKSTNYGIGGTCITHIEGKTNAIVDRLQNYSKDVDYCIVQGGLNDTAQAGEILGEITDGYTAQLNTSTYCGAMEFICKYLATNYSDKKYGFIVTYQISSTKWNTTWGDKTVEILKKWGIPYIDLRYCAGFNLASPDMRKFFGTYIGDVALFDPTEGYALDEQVKYNGALYKANVDIPSPAGEFDDSKWTLQESDNASDYDNWHCNVAGYKMIADKIEAWMISL